MNHKIISKAKEYETLNRNALLNDVLPFWEKHSPDWENGGFFSCLGRDGTVYDTDKFSWPQGRETWTFAKMYNHVEKKPEWLEMSKLGADFLKKYGRDENGDWYFSHTQKGKPIIQAYNIFSDYFAAIGLAQYAKASGDEESKEIAISTFNKLLDRRKNPKKHFTKGYPGTRPFNVLALPMIDTNVCIEIKDAFPEIDVEERITNNVESVLNDFINKETGLLHEAISPNKEDMDTYEGRVNIPGHGIECGWFIMQAAEMYGRKDWTEKAIDFTLKTLDFGWDKEHGGLFYFLDMMGKPPQQLEWDQKLWWAHNETLITLALGFLQTGNEKLAKWHDIVHDYTWSVFPDPKYGEWIGYLNRENKPLLDLKGSKWKGCFHVPRALWLCADIMNKIDTKYN